MTDKIRNDIAGNAVQDLARDYGTPTFFYQQEIIEKRISELSKFDTVRYAQKACGNIAILSLMRAKGVKVDAVSAGEIFRAIQAGYKTGPDSDDVVYTADLFDRDAVDFIRKYQVPVNVGSPDMITQLGEIAPGSRVILRVNPGFGHGHSQKVNTGGKFSKHGIWFENLEQCFQIAKEAGVSIHGLHMHIGSGSDLEHLGMVCDAMVQVAGTFGPGLEVISAGGGLSIPYHKDEPRIDLKAYYGLWNSARKSIEEKTGRPLKLEIEPGRYLVAESCVLLTQIRSVKNSGGTDFYLVDAGFETLVRPAMYGAYHEISVSPADGKAEESGQREVVVAGPLCESCDVFTQEEDGTVSPRSLPHAGAGDFILIHDAGAYGSAMSSNYNSKRLAAEVLLSENGSEIIRERQTFEAMLQFERIPDRLKQ
ncbi:diaminopimelate decarboxylase [Fibrobacterota bacterium]